MVEQSPSIAALATALVAAQADLANPVKQSVNPFFRSKYADLATVRDAVVPVLALHGLAVIQMPSTLDGQPALTSQLVHTSGEWIRSMMPLCVSKQDPQGQGSAITYARRYALQAFAGVAAEDDDGNAASRPTARQTTAVVKPAPARPTDAEVRSVLVGKGWGWSEALAKINRNSAQFYGEGDLPKDVEAQTLRGFVMWLQGQPRKRKAVSVAA